VWGNEETCCELRVTTDSCLMLLFLPFLSGEDMLPKVSWWEVSRGRGNSVYLMLCWKSGPYLKIKLRPYAFDIFTNFRLIIYMTLKAIVATKIVEYKKRGINQYVRSLKRLDCLVVRQKGHWNKVSRKPLKLARCKCLIINSSNMQFQVSQNHVFLGQQSMQSKNNFQVC